MRRPGRHRPRRRPRVAGSALAALLLVGGVPGALAGQQSISQYRYDNLGFRGFGVEVGRIFPTRVEPTYNVGVRMDLGYLGPGLRIVPGMSYWSSTFEDAEVDEFERRLEELVNRQQDPGAPPVDLELGVIDWSDLVLTLDAHVVWAVGGGFLTYAGAGASVHLMNGEGQSIAGTFVEDLLDAVTAGANLHAGLEYPLWDRLRLYATGRYEALGDLQYLDFRVGAQFMIAPPAPGEERGSGGSEGRVGGPREDGR